MCGINGFNWKNDHLIRQMNEVTKYRGPDDEGFYLDDDVSLGHRRLSIIDLTSAGKQPMFSSDGKIGIVYNGEIYNYQELNEELAAKGHIFNSKSDTETILHCYQEYGLDCFNKFNGMWSLSLYDRENAQMILCRDRYAIKPLYYYADRERFIFSSMITAILCHDIPVRPDRRAIMEFLAFNLEHHDDFTFFENIHSLMPGHLLVYDLKENTCRVDQWYRMNQKVSTGQDELRAAFKKSIRYHNVSDVPVGVLLSGGIDSTAIATVLDHYAQDAIQTYSIVVPGSPVDESVYIEEVGKHIDSQAHMTETNVDEFMQDLDEFVSAMEEPVASFGVYAEYKIFKMARQNGTKVLMNGQGGDELFAGYEYYYAYYFYELLTRLKWFSLIKEMLLYVRNSRKTFAIRMFTFLLMPEKLRLALWKRFVNPWVNHEMMQHVLGDQIDPRWKRMNLRDSLEKTLSLTSVPHLCMWVDKSSMRWSVESRVPFLEVGLVELAMNLEPEQVLKDGETKVILKRAIWDFLPEMIKNRKNKIAFQAPPLDDFFRSEPLLSYAREIFYSDSFKKRPYWHWEKIEKTFLDHVSQKTNAGLLLGKWLSLELWHRKFIDPYFSD